MVAQSRRAARNLATSSKMLLWALKKKDKLWSKLVDVLAGLNGGLNVLNAVGKRKGDLLGGRRARFPDMVARNRDRIEVGDFLGGKRERIRNQAHRRLRRVNKQVPGDILFHDVVLDGAPEFGAVDALLVTNRNVHRQQDDGRGVDRHAGRDLVEWNPLEDGLEIRQRVDGDAGFADLAGSHRGIRVVAHLRREIERHREARRALVDQIVEPLVCFAGGAHPRILAHRPQSTAVHRRVDTPRVRFLARKSQLFFVVEISDILGCVQAVDRLASGVGLEALGALAKAFEGWLQRLGFPLGFGLADRREVLVVEHCRNPRSRSC